MEEPSRNKFWRTSPANVFLRYSLTPLYMDGETTGGNSLCCKNFSDLETMDYPCYIYHIILHLYVIFLLPKLGRYIDNTAGLVSTPISFIIIGFLILKPSLM